MTLCSLIPTVQHGQRRHLLAAHKIIHGETEKLIKTIPENTNTSMDAPAEDDHTTTAGDKDINGSS